MITYAVLPNRSRPADTTSGGNKNSEVLVIPVQRSRVNNESSAESRNTRIANTTGLVSKFSRGDNDPYVLVMTYMQTDPLDLRNRILAAPEKGWVETLNKIG